MFMPLHLPFAGLDEAGERGCRGGCHVLIQDTARQSARRADHPEADGHCCLAAGPQQGRAGPLSGLSMHHIIAQSLLLPRSAVYLPCARQESPWPIPCAC